MTRLSAAENLHILSFIGAHHDDFRTIFYALMSSQDDDEDDDAAYRRLDEAVDLVNENPEHWADDFRYDLEGLRSFRQFYGRRMSDYTPQQREMLKAYDENWTYELVQQMLGHSFQPPPPEETPEPTPTVH